MNIRTLTGEWLEVCRVIVAHKNLTHTFSTFHSLNHAVASRPHRHLEGTAYPNIVVGAKPTGATTILNNAGTFTLENLDLGKGTTNVQVHPSIAFGDFDGDGDNDIILG